MEQDADHEGRGAYDGNASSGIDRENSDGQSDIDNHGALTICLHAGGNLASVKTGLGLL